MRSRWGGRIGRATASCWRVSRSVLALCVLLQLAGARGARLDAGDLTRAVPSDSVFYLHYDATRGGDFHGLLESLGSSLRQVRVFEPVRDILHIGPVALQNALIERTREETDERVRERYDQEVTRLERQIRTRRLDGIAWEKILNGVDWWNLVSREGVIAARFEGERREWLAGFRVAGERDQRLRELQEALYGLGAVIPGLQLLVSQRATSSPDAAGVDVTVLFNVFDPREEICIGGAGEFVLVATSRTLLRRSLRLLEGESAGIALSSTPDYERSVADLRRQSREPWAGKLFADGPLSTAGFQLLVRPGALLPELPMLGSVELLAAAGDAIDGEVKWLSTVRFAAPVSGETSRLRDLCLEQSSLDGFTASVPRDATWFGVSCGSRPERLLDVLLEVAKQIAPVGRSLADSFEGEREDLYLELRDSLLPAFTGRRVVSRTAEGYVGRWELKTPVARALAAWKRVAVMLQEAGPGSWRAPKLETLAEDETLSLLRLSLPVPFLPSVTLGVALDSFVVAGSEDALQALLKESREEAGPRKIDYSQYSLAPGGELRGVSSGTRNTLVGAVRAGLGLSPALVQLLVPGRREAVSLQPFAEVAVRVARALEELDRTGPKTVVMVRGERALMRAVRVSLSAR